MVKIRQRVSIRELVSIANTDRATRVSFSPFGNVGGTLFAGGAVPWKLLRKAPSEGLADYLRRLESVNSGVASGLSSAIRISVDSAGVTGVALVQTSGGGLKVMPVKSARQSIGRPVSVTRGGRTRTEERVVRIVAQAPNYSGLIPSIAQAAAVPAPAAA